VLLTDQKKSDYMNETIENRFRISGIDRMKFAVENLDEACRFAADWGLIRITAGQSDGALYRSVDGSEVEIVLADSSDPQRTAVGGPFGLCEITWGVTDPSALQELEAELLKDREATWGSDHTLHSVDDLGIRQAFRLTRRRSVSYEPTRYNSPGRPDRMNRRAMRYTAAVPHEISHIAIGVDDAGESVRFYIDRLGFIVSDRYANRGIFLRCAPRGNHHHMFLMNSKVPGTRLNHLAFKVKDVHEVIGGGQNLDALGWKTFAGPGRHLVSSACFWYFITPLGCEWEYAADEDVVSESWETTDFDALAHIFSEWTFGLEKSDGTLRGPISLSKELFLEK
jgi:hypothetical protein